MIDKTGKKPSPQLPKTAADRRREKLAQALRANLKRRKEAGGAGKNVANLEGEAESAANAAHPPGAAAEEG